MARFWGGWVEAGAAGRWQRGQAIGLALLLAALAWVAWSDLKPRLAGPVDPVLQRIRDSGVLCVGDAVEAPDALVDAAGAVTGESPELARFVAHALVRLAQASQGGLLAYRLPAWPGAAADHLAFAFQPAQRGLRDAWNAVQRQIIGGTAHLAVLQRFQLDAVDLVDPPAASGATP